MHNTHTSIPIIVTTQTWRGRATAALTRLALVVIALAAAFAALRCMVPSANRLAILVGAVLVAGGIAMFVVGPLSDRFERRGSWRLDAAGARFHPLEGSVRAIAWDDVHRVRWGPHRIVLGTTQAPHLAIGSGLLGIDEWKAMRNEVRAQLGADIDLPPATAATSMVTRIIGSPRVMRLGPLINVTLIFIGAAWLVDTSTALWPLVVAALIATGRAAWAVLGAWRQPWLPRALRSESRLATPPARAA